VPPSYEGIAGGMEAASSRGGLATLPQVMLQRVSSFKPQPNGKTISIKESKLTSRDGASSPPYGKRNPKLRYRLGSYVRYARQSVDRCKVLSRKEIKKRAEAETRIKGSTRVGVIPQKQRRASQTLSCPASRFMLV
jgi:hypothetical protein